MTRLKLGILTVLVLLPVAALVGVGCYHLYATGWSFVAWFPLSGCFALAYVLAWQWSKQSVAALKATPANDGLPVWWTARDKSAWAEVLAFTRDAKAIDPDDAANAERYAAEAQALALRLVRLERPDAADPFSHLTIPELLTCGELVSRELHDLTVKSIPGSHLVRIGDLMRARQAVDWYQTGRTAYWAASAIMNPISTAVKFVATKVGLQSPFEQVRHTALQWYHAAYLQQLGRYLIELNSGRLKAGAAKYRELLAAHRDPLAGPAADEPAEAATETRPIQVAVIGQVKAGKSSLVNALLGEAKAGVAVTPETDGKTTYVLALDNKPAFVLHDTAGYGLAGVTERDVAAAIEVAAGSDIIVLVAQARSAARKSDLELLDKLKAAFAEKRGLILPPVVLALTHVDLLTPAVEWQPPYDWVAGDRPKEKSIRDAVAAAKESFGSRVSEVSPLCTAAGKEYGVQDHLLAALLGRIGEARGVAIVRALEAESAKRPLGRIGEQLFAAGKTLYRMAMKDK